MKHYVRAIYQSFGNPALYAQVIYRWVGNGFVYMLILATLMGVLLAVQFSVAIYHFNRTELPQILTQLPDIKVADGQVSTGAAQPYLIVNAKKDVLVTIDTTKTEPELETEKGALLVGKNFILTRQIDNSVKRIDLTDLGTGFLTVNATTVKSVFHQLQYLAFLFVPFLILMQWLIVIVLSIVAAMLSYVVTAYMPEEYNFETRLRMGAIAVTPPLIINKILQVTTPYHLGFWIILAIWVLHLYVMVVATRHYVRQHTLDA